jgi:hypothetical protein
VTALIDMVRRTENAPGPEQGEDRRANQPDVVNVTVLEPDSLLLEGEGQALAGLPA